MSSQAMNKSQDLIRGGGETGMLIRSKDWEASLAGDIKTWHPSLRNTVNFLINSKFPMFLFWGRDFRFFYNDKWQENFNLDKGLDNILGEPAEKAFTGFWHNIHPIIKSIYDGDESQVGIDHSIPVTAVDDSFMSVWKISFCPLYDETGAIQGILATVNEDQTSSYSLTSGLKKEDIYKKISKLDSIIQSSNDAIIGMSPIGIITSWNQSAVRIFGYTAEEMVGNEADIMLPEHKLHEEEEITTKIKNGQKIINHITQRLTKDKKLIDISLSVSPLFDNEGNIIGVSKIVRDITNQVRNEQLIIENEERLQIILSASDLGTWELNLVTDEIKYSKKYLEILGYNAPHAFTHKELLKHMHPGDIQVRDKAMKNAMDTGLLNYEFRLIWADGSVRWVEARGQVFYDDEKHPLKLIGTFRDITERRSRVDELRESEQKFRILADSVPQLIWTGDINGNLNYFNLSLFEYTGLTPKQIRKDGWIQIVHPDDRLESVQQWAIAVDEGKPFLTEHRFKRYDGEYRWHLSRALPQKDTKGFTHMWVGTSTDVHDQKIASESLEKNVEARTVELKRAIDELVKTNQELEQFAYVSSHDLQEPLRKIQTFSGILSGKLPEGDEAKMYLDKINSSANRMSELIRDLLNYSKLSKREDQYLETDLNEILEKVKNDFEVLIQQKKAIILATRLPVVRAIPIQMNQLLYNLIGNSLKFCDKKPFIEISVKKATAADLKNFPDVNPVTKYYHIMFKDNGIGFSQEYAQQIFTIFQRLNDIQKYSGTGIGLAMCKKIVENHNGFISAESQPDRGATFNVFLPYS